MIPAAANQPASASASRWAPFASIIAVSALAHLWCLGSQFYMDDTPAILHNRTVVEGTNWHLSILWTQLGYWLQYHLFGFSAVGFHAINWLLHTAVACVLFVLGRDLLARQAALNQWEKPANGTALFGALLFAAHPLASEIPNYARTQDLAWVTLFSLLACWALTRFLQHGGRQPLLWLLAATAGASLSKGPGIFHVLMMTGTVGLVSLDARQWRALRRWSWLIALVLLGGLALWMLAVPQLLQATKRWDEPRFIGHAYTLARVFWEFAWRAVMPLRLCSDHQIAESLVPPGSGWLGIPDHVAMWAAAAMLAFTAASIVLTTLKTTRMLGVCLFLFVATIWFRVAYLIPEFMPEYRIYPGMPWFCLGAAIAMAAAWRQLPAGLPPRVPAVLLVLVLAALSAKRSLVWHDLDRLAADILRQYPAQARALWELNDRDAAAGNWQAIITRQRDVWPKVFASFMDQNRRLTPRRELPSGHFALADVACAGRYAEALAHTSGVAAANAELRRLEIRMRRLGMDPKTHPIQWTYLVRAQAAVLECAGQPQAALDLVREHGGGDWLDMKRLEHQLKPGS